MLTNITSIKNIRKTQLDKQQNIDNELTILENKCPHIVSEYLLFQRFLSRIQQKEMINSNIIDMVPIIHKHFDKNNKIYDDFSKILNCEDKCVCLKNIIY